MNIPKDPFSLHGRYALVTGATGYFGRVFSRALCDFGANVILSARNSEDLLALQQDLLACGHEAVQIYASNLRDVDEVDVLSNKLVSTYDKLDIVINNAHAGPTATVETAAMESFDAANEITLKAPFQLVQLLLPLLRKAGSINPGGASVINIASMYGMVSPDPSIYGDSGFNNPPYYGATKAGLIQLTRYLACHLAKEKVRVNSISPGPFPPLRIREDQPEFHANLCRKVPLGRMGLPEELIGALVFLASDASSYVTGINLPVDGGWTAW